MHNDFFHVYVTMFAIDKIIPVLNYANTSFKFPFCLSSDALSLLHPFLPFAIIVPSPKTSHLSCGSFQVHLKLTLRPKGAGDQRAENRKNFKFLKMPFL